MLRTVIAALLGALLVPLGASGQDIIISEIMPNPDAVSDSDGEYIEIYNQTTSDITLDGWTLTVDADDDELDGVTVPAQDFVVLCENGDASANGGVTCALDYVNGISLLQGGSTVTLENGSGTQVDQVNYGSDWPFAAGASMEYVAGPGGNNNVQGNWQEADEKGGDFAGNAGADFGSPNANAAGGQLPVELATFDAMANADRVHLTWRTTSEINNAGFAVQHQAPSTSNWQKLGFVQGEGTTSQPRSYRFTTDRLSVGVHTFRLKQVDADGTTQVLEPETVSVRGKAGLQFVSSHPVVKGAPAEVAVQVGTRQSVTLSLYDALGQRVRTVMTTRAAPAQPVRTTVSTGDLASGVYFLRAQGLSFERTKKLTVVR
jgi:hypothetical protein